MKAIVIGLGSMGKRRIRLIRDIDSDVSIIGVDTSDERRTEASEEYGITCFNSLEAAAAGGADCAFICTSPLSHAEIISSCLDNGLNVFTELNLVPDKYDENIKKAREKKLTLFISSTFLYRAEIKYIISRVSESKSNLNYIYHIGQYLPDWHPWEDYRNYFIGNKNSNGCREIMAIELPWLITCFGKIKNINSNKSKNTSLNIDYDDNYMIEICHENGTKGFLAVDVVTRKAVRRFEAFGEDLYLAWNGTPDTLYDYNITEKKDVNVSLFDSVGHRDGYASFITEEPYREEIASFFEKIKNPGTTCAWNFEKDGEMLKIIKEIGA